MVLDLGILSLVFISFDLWVFIFWIYGFLSLDVTNMKKEKNEDSKKRKEKIN